MLTYQKEFKVHNSNQCDIRLFLILLMQLLECERMKGHLQIYFLLREKNEANFTGSRY